MHIRCGLGCRLSGKTFVRAIANYLAVHLRHSSSTALPSICYPPEKMKCYGRVEGGGRQGGGGAEAACPGVGRVSHLLHNAADPPERRRRPARRRA